MQQKYPTKVIFLDVDGVLNSDWFYDRFREEHGYDAQDDDILDDGAMENLKKIIDATGADIVLSSSWRYYEESAERVAVQLSARGMQMRRLFVIVTTNSTMEERVSRLETHMCMN